VLVYICTKVHIDLFQTLADPTRRRVVEALRHGEMQVGEIVDRAGIHQSGVSRHLRILHEAGFVSRRAEGQRRLYSLRATRFRELNEWLAKYLSLWVDRFGDARIVQRQRRKTAR
jgi:DNA-binding transcriptional ArsR family regulator